MIQNFGPFGKITTFDSLARFSNFKKVKYSETGDTFLHLLQLSLQVVEADLVLPHELVENSIFSLLLAPEPNQTILGRYLMISQATDMLEQKF